MCPDSVSVSDSVVASEADGKPVRGREIPPGGGDDAPSRSPWRPPEDRRPAREVRSRDRVDELIKIIRNLPTDEARATAAREAAMELVRPLAGPEAGVVAERLAYLLLLAGEAGEAPRITVDDAAGRAAAFAGAVARIAEETIRQIREIDSSEDKERFACVSSAIITVAERSLSAALYLVCQPQTVSPIHAPRDDSAEERAAAAAGGAAVAGAVGRLAEHAFAGGAVRRPHPRAGEGGVS